jgi:hypothetical protein
MFEHLRKERGISTVIAVVSLLGLFAAALLSLDFGQMWSSRRQIITATDATVLQQAKAAALAGSTGPDCTAAWTDFLYRNANNIVTSPPPVCALHPDSAHPGTGYVTVEARKFADTRFGGLFGFGGDTKPYSLSAAEYGFGNPTGLRPMSFCLLNAHVLEWAWYQNWLTVQRGGTANANFGQLDGTTYNNLKGDLDAGHPPITHYPVQTGDTILFESPVDGRIDYPQGSAANGTGGTSYASYGVVHRMYFTKDTAYESGNCGGSSGNWGWIDFNGGSNSTSEQNDWVENGYDGEAAANDCNADGTSGDPCSGDPGSSGASSSQELDDLITSQAVFYIPIFNTASINGSNAEFTMWGFLPLVLRGYKLNGSESDRYFDFEFKDVIASSAGGISKTGGIGSAKVVKICAVDHDGDTSDATIASHCGG